jgi:hypothetical protein
VIPGEVERQFSELVEAVKTEVRSRHYSYRTETAYLDWVRRFIAFHDYGNPAGLDTPTAVKATAGGQVLLFDVMREIHELKTLPFRSTPSPFNFSGVSSPAKC